MPFGVIITDYIMISHENISEDEAALYDRQIRLWGLQAQSRLKSARLLLIGLSPVANEIVKNIVLCGINTLTICDDKLVRKSDVDQGFFYENSHIGLMVDLYSFVMPLDSGATLS